MSKLNEAVVRAVAPKTFQAKDAEGNVYRWTFWRDARPPASWVLKTHDGVERTLEANWIDSVPRIRLIAENYGFTVEVS